MFGRERERVTARSGGRVLTKQSLAEATDVNAIMRRYAVTGEMPRSHNTPESALYGDFSDVGDYHSALNRVRTAQAFFDGLPSDIRNACENDPHVLIELLTDPAHREQATELGFFPPPDESRSGEVGNPANPLPPEAREGEPPVAQEGSE